MRSSFCKSKRAIHRSLGGPRALLTLACAAALTLCSLTAPLAAQEVPQDIGPRGLPPALQNVGFDPQLAAPLPLDLVFRDEAGRAVRLGDYFHGQPVLLAFVYYRCPMLCNQIQVSLIGALKMISFTAGREYEVVLVSFDARETHEMAARKKQDAIERYGRAGSSAGWHFLTGGQGSIDALTRAANFRYAFDAQKNLFAHASGILILTRDGKISRYFFGIDFPPRDIRLGLVEASAGKIGTPADRLVLFCYAYDPATGRYSTMILRLVRAGGILVVAALVAAFLVFRRRESAARAFKSPGAD
ncbi:MAG TPA: SCO family protein [Candidatus Dormibacteraeota bacterium]|nr:SCO family protein [Candidatus Dormibacteraeota bacterium]